MLLHFKASKVRLILAPIIDGLRVKDILSFAKKYCRIKDYLPEYKKNKMPNRTFLCNLGMYIIYANFSE